MLLQNYEQYEVVKSSGIGILQHDAFTWQIEDGKFVKAVDIEAKQKRMNEALNQWIFTLPEEERQLFVETLFQVIDQTGVTTLTEFSEHWKENLKSCLKSLKSLDPETRKRIRRIIKILLEIYGNTLRGEKKNEIGKADLPHRRQQRLFELECAGEAARSAGQSRFKDSAIGSWWR